MASKIDVSALTLNPQEATEISKAIIELAFIQNEIKDTHDVQTGIEMQEQIVFAGNLEIGGEALTGCTPAEQDGLVFTQKYWNPKIDAGRLTHCAADMNNLLKLFVRAKKVNPDFFDRIGSQELGLLMVKVAEVMKTQIYAKAWYGDTAAAELGSGGNFKIGTNLNNWNQIDGFWKQIYAEATIGRYTITANTGVDYAGQVLAAGESYNILKGMYELADDRLIDQPDAYFKVTRSIWDNYLTYSEGVEKNGGIMKTSDDGRPMLDYRGIRVVKDSEQDRIAKKYQDNGTVVFNPHKAVLTVPANLPIGTLSEEDLQKLESWYEKKDKSNYIDYAYSLDAKMLESYMIVAAY